MSEASGKAVATAGGRSGRRSAEKKQRASYAVGPGIKAYVLVDSGERATPLSLEPPDDPFSTLYPTAEFGKEGLVGSELVVPREPPVAFSELCTVFAESCILPQCADAVECNVEGQGFDLQEGAGLELEKQPKELQVAARMEKRQTEAWLRSAAGSAGQSVSWTKMLRQSRCDLEPLGWRAFEVLCMPAMGTNDPLKADPLGLPVGLNHIEAEYLRWCEGVETFLVTEYVCGLEYDEKDPDRPPVPVYRPLLAHRQFRLLVYWRDTSATAVYFRQFGDPRIIHAFTGKRLGRYDRKLEDGSPPRTWRDLLDKEWLDSAEEEVGPATWANEILVQTRYSPVWTPYGKPWWYGVSTVSEGLTAGEDANYAAIHHPKIPRVIITSEGRQTSTSELDRIQEQVDQRDEPAAHAEMLLVETEPHIVGDETTGEARASRGQLNVHQISVLPDQGLFVEWDDQGRKKVRSARGLSSMSVGLSDEYTYASARAALLVEDARVYAPERTDLDELIGRVMARRRLRWWKYTTKSAQIVSPDESSSAVTAAEAGGALTPNAHRSMLEKSVGVRLPKITEPWGDQPFELTKIQAQAGMVGGVSDEGVQGDEGRTDVRPGEKGMLPPVVQALVNLRGALTAMRTRHGGDDGDDGC